MTCDGACECTCICTEREATGPSDHLGHGESSSLNHQLCRCLFLTKQAETTAKKFMEHTQHESYTWISIFFFVAPKQIHFSIPVLKYPGRDCACSWGSPAVTRMRGHKRHSMLGSTEQSEHVISENQRGHSGRSVKQAPCVASLTAGSRASTLTLPIRPAAFPDSLGPADRLQKPEA